MLIPDQLRRTVKHTVGVASHKHATESPTMTDWIRMEDRGPPVTEADVAYFETRIGMSLPQDYRAFLVEVNGGRPDRSNCEISWRRSAVGINTFFSLNDPDENLNLLTTLEWEASTSSLPSPDLISIAYVGVGPLLLAVRGSHRGEVWVLDDGDPRPVGSNPRVLWHDRRDMDRVASSFRALLGGLRPEGFFPLR